jgi:hypothetical protein
VPARPRRLTGGPRLSAAVLPRARPPSLARCPVGPICRRQFPSPAHSLSLSVSRAWIASRQVVAPSTPFFSLYVMGLPCQFRPLRAHRGPARAHSRTSPDFSAMMPAHAPSSLLRAPPVPRAQPSPHFSQLHPLSRSTHAAGVSCPRSWPTSSPETAPNLPELHPEVRHLSPCPISSIAPCVRPISSSSVLGRGGPPCSRGGRSI